MARPTAAVAFRLFSMVPATGTTESGAKRRGYTQKKINAPPDQSGRSGDLWPPALFDPATLRAAHGVGRYRAEWIDGGGKVIGRETFELRDLVGPQVTPATSPATSSAAPVGLAPGVMMGPGGVPLDPWTLMQMMDQRAERAEERARADAQRATEREREFTTKLLEAVRGPAVVAGAAAPAGGVDARERDLMAREMKLEMREAIAKETARLRAEFEANAPDDDDDDYVPPKSVKQAASRVGIKLIAELEDQAPELLKAGIPVFIEKLKDMGFRPSRELEREARGALRGKSSRTNGEAKREDEPEATDDDVAEVLGGAAEH
jgi:hypothetical protein